jgi:hypothetical protein
MWCGGYAIVASSQIITALTLYAPHGPFFLRAKFFRHLSWNRVCRRFALKELIGQDKSIAKYAAQILTKIILFIKYKI